MAFDQNAYIAQYNKENYARIELKIPKDMKADWTIRAKSEGKSLTAWICGKINDECQTYIITDDSGFVYERGIAGKIRAEIMFESIIREYRGSGEKIPEGLVIINEKERRDS